MDERVRAQTKKCVCFTKGPGRLTSLLIFDAACMVRIVCILSDICATGTLDSSVQDLMVRTVRPSRGEKCR